MCWGKLWIEFQRPLEKRQSCGKVTSLRPVPERTLPRFPGGQGSGRLLQSTAPLDVRNCRVDRSHDCLGDLVLDCEEVGQVAIESFSPDVMVSLRINKLRCNPYAVATPLHATLDDVADIKFTGYLLYPN